MTKLFEYRKAIDLRKKGKSIKTIAKKLHLSTSTVSRWSRNVELTPEQREILLRNAHDPYFGRRRNHILNQKRKKQREIGKEKDLGIKDVGKLTKRELFIIGIGLYWAEGFKKDRRLGFANSDPMMIKLFIKWITICGKVPKEDIRLRVGLNISHANRVHDVEKYWSNITDIPLTQYQKPFFQKFIWKKNYLNSENYYGVLRLRANKQLKLFRRIAGWIEGIKLTATD